MALYLFRFSFAPEVWAALMSSPQDRRDVLASRLFGFGGHLQGYWYSFGEFDGYALAELPDNVSAAAVSTAVTASGSFRRFDTTVLLSVDEMLEALDRARDFAYESPSEQAGAVT
jgi:uncharacterized protein with GYD domain